MAARKKKAKKKSSARKKRKRTAASKAAQTKMARERAEQKRTLERELKKAAFLEGMRKKGTVRAACKFAKIKSRDTVYEWRDDDKDFERAWLAAVADFDDLLEEEAIRRGKDGVLEPVYQQKVLVGKVRRYSDGLLTLALRARNERYHQRAKLDLNHAGGVAVIPADADPDNWDELLKKHGEMQTE